MFQSEVDGRIVPWELLTKDVPPDHHQDLDYLVELLDWDANVEPEVRRGQSGVPEAGESLRSKLKPEGYREVWVWYGTGWYSAKELTVLPKRTRHDQGRRRLRHHSDAGIRTLRRAAGVDAVDDPVRTDDRGRVVRDGRRCEERRSDRESQRDRSAGDPETLRAWKSRRGAAAEEERAIRQTRCRRNARWHQTGRPRGRMTSRCGKQANDDNDAQTSSHPQRDVAGSRRQGRPGCRAAHRSRHDART